MPTNNFLPFCPTDTGTNLLTNAEYNADADRVSGNKPGVASSKLSNKSIRQSSFITSQLAQWLSDTLNQDVLDTTGSTATILKQFEAAFKNIPSTTQSFLSGSGNYNLSYQFFITAGSATAGATYTNNSITFTVKETISSGTLLWCTGAGDPTVSGTLTKSAGTGDATLTFSAFRKPIQIRIRGAGGGGGGGGADGGGPTAGGNGGNSTFGALITLNGGSGGSAGGGGGGTGGAFTIASSVLGYGIEGSRGGNGSGGVSPGGPGAATIFAGGGPAGGGGASAGLAPIANSGAGGGGGGTVAGASAGGGGAGAQCDVIVRNPDSVYAYAVGAAGTAGTGTFGGGVGSAGVWRIWEDYQ